MAHEYRTALIVGAGAGLSASLARTFSRAGMRVALAARHTDKLAPLAAEISGKGYAQSTPFAMGKFALRGLAQSLARELSPVGIHVAHFVIDGGIRSTRRPEAPDRPDSLLDPEAIATTYLHVLDQPRSAWTWEVE